MPGDSATKLLCYRLQTSGRKLPEISPEKHATQITFLKKQQQQDWEVSVKTLFKLRYFNCCHWLKWPALLCLQNIKQQQLADDKRGSKMLHLFFSERISNCCVKIVWPGQSHFIFNFILTVEREFPLLWGSFYPAHQSEISEIIVSSSQLKTDSNLPLHSTQPSSSWAQLSLKIFQLKYVLMTPFSNPVCN